MNQDLAIIGAIRASLIAEGLTVYDGTAPQDDPMPYVVIGEVRSNNADTDNTIGFEAMVDIHVWSEYRGRLEAANMQEQIYNALHRNDTLALLGNYHNIGITQDFAHVMVDPDNITRHGVQQFTITYDSPKLA